MKSIGTTTAGLFAGLLLLSQPVAAELPVPRHVFTMEELDEAKAKAAKDEEPLIFVYTSTVTT